MENFINGYPGHEHQFREGLSDVLGKEKADFFFDRVSLSRSTLGQSADLSVSRVLVHRGGRQTVCIFRLQLYPSAGAFSVTPKDTLLSWLRSITDILRTT